MARLTKNQERLANRLREESQFDVGEHAFWWLDRFLKELRAQGIGWDHPLHVAAWEAAIEVERAKERQKRDALFAVFLQEHSEDDV